MFPFNFASPIFDTKIALPFQQDKNGAPILRPMGHELDFRSKSNSRISCDGAPINPLPTSKVIVLEFLHVHANGTIAVGCYDKKVPSPKRIVNTP